MLARMNCRRGITAVVRRNLKAIAATIVWLSTALIAHASPAADFINGRHWMCSGTIYNSSLVEGKLPLRLILDTTIEDDGTFVHTAFVDYELDGQSYMAGYDATGYLFDNPTDGAGVYITKFALQRSQSADLSATELRWPDQFSAKLQAVAETGGESTYLLKGVYITNFNYQYDINCRPMQWPPDGS